MGITAGSREVPGRKLVTRDNNDYDDDDNNNNNNKPDIIIKNKTEKNMHTDRCGNTSR